MLLNDFQSVLKWMHPIWLQPGRGSPAKFKHAKRQFESLERFQDTICEIKIGENQNFAGMAKSQLALAKYNVAKYKQMIVKPMGLHHFHASAAA